MPQRLLVEAAGALGAAFRGGRARAGSGQRAASDQMRALPAGRVLLAAGGARPVRDALSFRAVPSAGASDVEVVLSAAHRGHEPLDVSR